MALLAKSLKTPAVQDQIYTSVGWAEMLSILKNKPKQFMAYSQWCSKQWDHMPRMSLECHMGCYIWSSQDATYQCYVDWELLRNTKRWQLYKEGAVARSLHCPLLLWRVLLSQIMKTSYLPLLGEMWCDIRQCCMMLQCHYPRFLGPQVCHCTYIVAIQLLSRQIKSQLQISLCLQGNKSNPDIHKISSIKS